MFPEGGRAIAVGLEEELRVDQPMKFNEMLANHEATLEECGTAAHPSRGIWLIAEVWKLVLR
jgi:hypothetical protein